MRCYVVLWIPTIVYSGSLEVKRTVIERNISDIPDNFNIVKTELLSNGDIDISSKHNEEYEHIIRIERKAVSSNGLMLFRYESTGGDTGFRFTREEFPTAVYHMIKGFYHNHDFHEIGEDSTLPPFLSSRNVNIKAKDNPALLHYLKAYSEVIENSVRYLHLAMGKVRSDKKTEVRPEIRSRIERRCLYAIGFDVYMGVLYRSKYNTKCRPANLDDKDWRHRACNIENGIRYIHTIAKEYEDYAHEIFVGKVIDDAKASVKESRFSTRLGLASVILGLFSILPGLFQSLIFPIIKHSSNKLEQASEILINPITDTLSTASSDTVSVSNALLPVADSL